MTSIQDRLAEYEDISNVVIVAIGGRLRGRTLQSVEKFSFASSKWEICPFLNENRGSHGAACINNVIYTLGGGGIDSNLSTCEKWCLSDESWTFFASMNSKRHALGVVSWKNYIYALGGWYDGSLCSSELERYDFTSDKWEHLASMQTGRRLLGSTVWRDNILAFGGCCEDGVWNTSIVESYDIPTNKWTYKKKMPLPGPCSAACVNDNVYVLIHGKFVYHYDPELDVYKKLCPLPVEDWHCFEVVGLKRFILAFGGVSLGRWLKCFWIFDTADNTWWSMPDMLRQRRRCAIALVNSETNPSL